MNHRRWWVVGLQCTGIGWYIAGAIVLGALGGVWLDGWAGTSPLFLLLGVLLGVVLAFYGTYRMAMTFLVGEDDLHKGKGR